MKRQAIYREILSTDDQDLVFRYQEEPGVQPYVEVGIADQGEGTYVGFKVEPDDLRSALESLFGGIYSGEA